MKYHVRVVGQIKTSKIYKTLYSWVGKQKYLRYRKNFTWVDGQTAKYFILKNTDILKFILFQLF